MSTQQSESPRRNYFTPEASYESLVEAIKQQRPNACKNLLSALAVVEEDRQVIAQDAVLTERQSNLENSEASLRQFFATLEKGLWLRGFWSSLFMKREDREDMDRTRIRMHWYIQYVRDAQREAWNRLPNN
jgi:hypothetical protein